MSADGIVANIGGKQVCGIFNSDQVKPASYRARTIYFLNCSPHWLLLAF